MDEDKAVSHKAARLIYKALQTGLSPANDAEYRELLGLYGADLPFREVMHQVASGLELAVLDVTQERGAVLVPASGSSRFAMRLYDIRQAGMTPDAKAALVLAHVAIGAAFFPTTQSLEDDNYVAPPVSIAECRDLLRVLASRMRDSASPEAIYELPEDLRPGWECILALPMAIPSAVRAAPNSVVGIVRIALINMADHALVRIDRDREDDSATYTPTHRYRVQLRELTLRRLFEFAQSGAQE